MNKNQLQLISLIVVFCIFLLCGCEVAPMPVYTGEPTPGGSTVPSAPISPSASLPSESMQMTFTCWVFQDGTLLERGITVPAQLRFVQDPQGSWPSYLNFQLPESLYWRFQPYENNTGSDPRLDLVFQLNHYVTTVWFVGKDSTPEFGVVAISWEDGYVYMAISDLNVHILGSVHPESTPEEIKEYFSEFIQIFLSDD